MKAAAATGTAALIWTEPTIKGLVRRPAYAGAGSQAVTFSIPILAGQSISTFVSDAGVSLSLGGNPFEPITNVITPVLAGCVCTFDVPAMAPTLTIDNGIGGSSSDGAVQPDGTILWNPGIDPGVTPTLTTNATLTGTCVPA